MINDDLKFKFHRYMEEISKLLFDMERRRIASQKFDGITLKLKDVS